MSDKERSLAEQLAELPAAVQDKFLLMAQGAAVAVECAREEKKGTGALAPSVACGDSSLPEGARTGETDCHGAAPLAMTEDDGGAA